MRTYGRVPNPFPPSGNESTEQLGYGDYIWIVIETDEDGFFDYGYITTLIQCFQLNLGESPFFAQFGIPQKDAIIQQVQPDYYVAFLQTYFSQFFASLIIAKKPQIPANFVNSIQPWNTPTYNVSVVRNNGSKFQMQVGL